MSKIYGVLCREGKGQGENWAWEGDPDGGRAGVPEGSPLHKDLKEAKREPQRHWKG